MGLRPRFNNDKKSDKELLESKPCQKKVNLQYNYHNLKKDDYTKENFNYIIGALLSKLNSDSTTPRELSGLSQTECDEYLVPLEKALNKEDILKYQSAFLNIFENELLYTVNQYINCELQGYEDTEEYEEYLDKKEAIKEQIYSISKIEYTDINSFFKDLTDVIALFESDDALGNTYNKVNNIFSIIDGFKSRLIELS